jgi:high affinity Mn2+ porin
MFAKGEVQAMSRRAVPVLLIVLLGVSAISQAHPPDPAETPAPASESPSAAPEQSWLERLDATFRATTVLQSTPKGAPVSEARATDAPWSFVVEISMPVMAKEAAHISFETGKGAGLDGRLSSISGFNGNAVDDQPFRLYELWLEHRWVQDRLRLRAGVADLTYLFDLNAVANCQWEQFLSPGFVNNLGVELPDDTGPAAALWVSPSPHLDLGVGLAEADADLGDVLHHAFQIAEADFKAEPGGQSGSLRVYGWRNNLEHVDLKDASRSGDNGRGLGISADQAIGKGLSLFGRWARRNGSVYVTDGDWSAGLQHTGAVVASVPITLGLAYVVAHYGTDWALVSKTAGVACDDERHLELYSRFELNPHVSLTPDVQWVANRDGNAAQDAAWVVGLRARLTF